MQRLFNPLSSLFGRREKKQLPDHAPQTEPVVNQESEHQTAACDTTDFSPNFAQEQAQKGQEGESQVIVQTTTDSQYQKIERTEQQAVAASLLKHFAQEVKQKELGGESQVIVQASQENQHQKVPSAVAEQAVPTSKSKPEIRNKPLLTESQGAFRHQAKIPSEKEPFDAPKQKEPLAPSVCEHHLPHAQPATSKPMPLMRLDTEIQIYDLDEPVRAVVDWEGDGEKVARLVVGIKKEELDSSAVHHCLRFRQRIEIMIKSLHRRLQLPHFGGGEALLTYPDLPTPDEAQVKKWLTNLRQMETRMKNSQERLKTVERELSLIEEDKEPTNSLLLALSDLKALAKRLRTQVERQGKRIEELRLLLSWANGQSEPPEQKEVAELCLTREAILTQLKLDVFTAQETLIDEFIHIGLMPVLYDEAKKQATERKRKAKRSTAKSKKGQLLCTDIEQLVQTKLANLERETILLRLLRQPGEFVRLKQKRLILCVFQPFTNKRMQAAFEHYCLFLNQQPCCLPIDEGPPWRVLFTYHKTGPSY